MRSSHSIQGSRDAGPASPSSSSSPISSSSFPLPLPAGIQKTLRSDKHRRSLHFGFHVLLAVLITLGLGYDLHLIRVTAGALVIHCLSRLQSMAPYRILVGFWMIAAGLFYPFGRAFGPPSYNTMVVLHATNVQESTDFVSLFPYTAYLMTPFLIGLGVLVLRQKRYEKPIWTRFDTSLAVLGVLLWFYRPFAVGSFVASVVKNKYAYELEQRRYMEMTRVEPTWKVLKAEPKYKTYVMVIGESVRRDAMGAFGGHWDNTPWASSVNGTLLTNYVSAACTTQISLSRTLTPVVDDQPQIHDSFIALANAAGFQTSWFSNLMQYEEWSTAISGIAARAHKQTFIRTQSDFLREYPDDDKLFPYAEQEVLAQGDKPQLIVVHLLGSHPRACARTQEKYDQFIVSKETSCYLYSMKLTDRLLERIHEMLKKHTDSFSLLYMGDHGLRITGMGRSWQYLYHSDTVKENYEVPFMVVSSDDTERRTINARRSARDWLQFFTQWTGLEVEGIPSDSYRFVSEDPASPGKTWVKDYDVKDQDYDSLPNNPFPLEPF